MLSYTNSTWQILKPRGDLAINKSNAHWANNLQKPEKRFRLKITQYENKLKGENCKIQCAKMNQVIPIQNFAQRAKTQKREQKINQTLDSTASTSSFSLKLFCLLITIIGLLPCKCPP